MMTELNDTLVITPPMVIKDTVFTAGPNLAGKTMIEIPSSQGQNRLEGARLKRVSLMCNDIANGMAIIDLYNSEFVDVKIIAPSQTALYLAGERFAMQFTKFEGLDIWCIGNATGLILDSNVANNANVCFCRFLDCYIHSETGRSLEIRDSDTCLFENCIFESVSGYSVLSAERGNNTWINCDTEKGKVSFAHPERDHFIGWSTLNGGRVPGS